MNNIVIMTNDIDSCGELEKYLRYTYNIVEICVSYEYDHNTIRDILECAQKNFTDTDAVFLYVTCKKDIKGLLVDEKDISFAIIEDKDQVVTLDGKEEMRNFTQLEKCQTFLKKLNEKHLTFF